MKLGKPAGRACGIREEIMPPSRPDPDRALSRGVRDRRWPISELFQLRAIAMDVVGGAGETRAVAADHWLESFIKPPIAGIVGGDAVFGVDELVDRIV